MLNGVNGENIDQGLVTEKIWRVETAARAGSSGILEQW